MVYLGIRFHFYQQDHIITLIHLYLPLTLVLLYLPITSGNVLVAKKYFSWQKILSKCAHFFKIAKKKFDFPLDLTEFSNIFCQNVKIQIIKIIFFKSYRIFNLQKIFFKAFRKQERGELFAGVP